VNITFNFLSLSFSLKMQIIYLSDSTDVSQLPLALYDTKGHNKYGTMYMLQDKIGLVTTDPITDYRVFTSENGKTFLCVKSPQLSGAIKGITDRLADQGHEFRPQKEMLYITLTNDQRLKLTKNQKLQVGIHVYGVFHQSSTKMSFLQMEVSDFRTSPLIDFDAMPH
jgi:hypothetical protein